MASVLDQNNEFSVLDDYDETLSPRFSLPYFEGLTVQLECSDRLVLDLG